MLSSAAAKSRPPRSACTGVDIEMVTPGGEIAFVSRMIDESKLLKDRCQWYTSMLGKYSSVEIVVENLKGVGVNNWAVKDLVHGSKTRRWVVAWSWGSMRPSSVSVTFFKKRYLFVRQLTDTQRTLQEALLRYQSTYSPFPRSPLSRSKPRLRPVRIV